MKQDRKHFLVGKSALWIFVLIITELIFTASVVFWQHKNINIALRSCAVLIGYIILLNLKERGKNNGKA